MFVSLLSLFTVVYQSYLGREENKLIRQQQMASSLPYLSQSVEYHDSVFKYIIANQGVGPAFIQDVSFKMLGPSGKDTLTLKNSDQLFRKLFKNQKDLKILTSTFRKGFLLPARDNKKIADVVFRSNDSGARLLKVIQDTLIGFRIDYEDVYGNKWYIGNETVSPIKVNKKQ